MRKELPWLCTTCSACIGNRKLQHHSVAMNVLQVTKDEAADPACWNFKTWLRGSERETNMNEYFHWTCFTE
ncbi:hypothetical protein AV530_015884 [Patagioenas fasciata monilis]|uniref:Uncharacterized protein n=1 Tax=Patagioenas fasciata monilis TaxID=372326 RepID=A0A1V4KJ74_PATFA|nr:hypothetical protein AV530_015884 [Patagioenas fasciata monilis]